VSFEVVAKRVKNEAGKRLSFEEGKIQKRPGRVVPLRSVLAKETSQLSRQLVFEFSSDSRSLPRAEGDRNLKLCMCINASTSVDRSRSLRLVFISSNLNRQV
jgi:hypothetical protein